MPRGLIGGIILTLSGVVFLISTIILFMNMESWVDHNGEDWRLLIPLFVAPVLIFVGIKSLYFYYLERKLLRKL